jgi:hypothetical protein
MVVAVRTGVKAATGRARPEDEDGFGVYARRDHQYPR